MPSLYPKFHILNSKQRGFSMIEMLVYVAMLASFSVFTVNSLLIIFSAWNNFRATQELNSSLSSALERIARETRYASTTDPVLSSFGAHPGRLVFQKTDVDTGLFYSEDFYLNGTRLAYKENNGAEQFLTADDVEVTSIIFRQMNNSNISKSVKIELAARSVKNPDVSHNFYLTATMRGDY